MQSMDYIGLDVHKKKISYCVKDGSGNVHAEGAIPATRADLDRCVQRPITASRTAALRCSPSSYAGWKSWKRARAKQRRNFQHERRSSFSARVHLYLILIAPARQPPSGQR